MNEEIQLFAEYVKKPPEEINMIFDCGMFNSICKGYTILAMRSAGIDENVIIQTVLCMDDIFNFYSAEDSREAFCNMFG